MAEEPARVIDFEAAARLRRPEAKPKLHKPLLLMLFLSLIAASIAFGLDGRMVSAVARFVTTTQCSLEVHAQRLFPSASGRQHVLPCELELVR